MSVSVTKNIETDANLSAMLGKLREKKNVGNNVRIDIEQHLTEVLGRIMQYYPFDGFDKFEEISIDVKKSILEKNDPMGDDEIKAKLATQFKALSDS